MALRILIADHRGDQVMPLVEFLLSRGMHTVICRSGGDAVDAIGVQLADEAPFDLIIAHVDLPEMNGTRVLYEARRLHLGTTAALVCPRHRRDEKVERMIRKVGITAVLEQHVDLTKVDLLLKQVVINRQAFVTKAKADRARAEAQAKADAAAAKAKAKARAKTSGGGALERVASQPERAPIEAFEHDRSGASALFFRADDHRPDDELPPIDGAGPPSAPTGLHQVLPPSTDPTPSPTMTASVPPTPRPSSGPFPQVQATPRPEDQDRQRRGLSSGGHQVPKAAGGKPRMVSVKCFRCGQIFKVKATGKVVSQPCLGCGQINDIRT